MFAWKEPGTMYVNQRSRIIERQRRSENKIASFASVPDRKSDYFSIFQTPPRCSLHFWRNVRHNVVHCAGMISKADKNLAERLDEDTT